MNVAGQWVRPGFALVVTLAGLTSLACHADQPTQPVELDASTTSNSPLSPINHVVVIYLENHSFDNLYGEFPGANGLSAASGTSRQNDSSETPYAILPPIPGGQFPDNLPNSPFNIEQYVPSADLIPDLVHRFIQEQQQIHHGSMDRFAAISNARGLVMGFYHTMKLPVTEEALKYTVCDNFFHAAFGGSFLNHQWLIAAATQRFSDAPASSIIQLDGKRLLRDGYVTRDGRVVNTAFTVNSPHPAGIPSASLVPNQTYPTIGDRLSDRHISWAWYSGGWNDAVAGNPDPLFQFHHQPFAYFANYADGTPGRAVHLKDEKDFFAAAAAGELPAVSFVKPLGPDNEHPGYATLLQGEQHTLDLINAVRNGPNWKDAAIIITYDENGGFWDHVPPPRVDQWGPGARVPTIIISPFAKRGFVDHSFYDTTSILALIEHRWGLAPLGSRDRAAADLRAALEFPR